MSGLTASIFTRGVSAEQSLHQLCDTQYNSFKLPQVLIMDNRLFGLTRNQEYLIVEILRQYN